MTGGGPDGAGRSVDFWAALTKPGADVSQVKADWFSLQVAWSAFSAHMADSAIPATAGGTVAASPAAPDPTIAPRERALITSIGTIAQDLAARAGVIQAAFTNSSVWNPPSPQTVPKLIQLYDDALAAFEALLPEAKALAELGHKDGLGYLIIHRDDTSTALATCRAMIGQQQAFNRQQTQIWNDARQSMTGTILDINQNMQTVFEQANRKFADYNRS